MKSHKHVQIRIVVMFFLVTAFCYRSAISVSIHWLITSGQMPSVVQSSPTNFDYDRDGQVEIIIGSGNNTGGLDQEDGELYIVGNNGNIEHEFPTPGNVRGLPVPASVGDINGDTYDEIVYVEMDDNQSPGHPLLCVIDHNGNYILNSPIDLTTICEGDGIWSYPPAPPIIYDLNGDGYQEILLYDPL